VLVFAHNNHLQRGKTQWQLGADLLAWWSVGSHLNEVFGPRYAVIGSAVGVSDANGIGQPEPGTLEAHLTAAPGPVRFIPTNNGRRLPIMATTDFPARSGSMNPTYFALTPRSLTDFDWLAVLDSTQYSRGGPTLK
jgi:erythromycin esterase-like protein